MSSVNIDIFYYILHPLVAVNEMLEKRERLGLFSARYSSANHSVGA